MTAYALDPQHTALHISMCQWSNAERHAGLAGRLVPIGARYRLATANRDEIDTAERHRYLRRQTTEGRAGSAVVTPAISSSCSSASCPCVIL